MKTTFDENKYIEKDRPDKEELYEKAVNTFPGTFKQPEMSATEKAYFENHDLESMTEKQILILLARNAIHCARTDRNVEFLRANDLVRGAEQLRMRIYMQVHFCKIFQFISNYKSFPIY